jgi:ribosomal protein L37AE/L43A
VKLVAATLIGLCLIGCGTTGGGPIRLATVLDATALPAWNAVAEGKTGTVLCPKCLQSRVSPRYARDPKGAECLVWSCASCGAVWYTRVGTPDLVTQP